MKLDSIKTLYLEELRDLYSAEDQLLKALPGMAGGASSDELKQALEDHLEQTREHMERLEEIFHRLGEKPARKTSQGMKVLIEKGEEMLKVKGPQAVIDAGLISAAQRIEHYEIAAYGTVRTFARLLGEEEAADLLEQTLEEEGEMDRHLTEIAEEVVNSSAFVDDHERHAVGARWR